MSDDPDQYEQIIYRKLSRVFGDADGADLLRHWQVLWAGGGDGLEDLLADIPHPYQAYCVIGVQRFLNGLAEAVGDAMAYDLKRRTEVTGGDDEDQA